MTRDRRTKEGYQLRVLIDGLKEAKAKTQEQWIAEWASHAGPDDAYISQAQFVTDMENWIVQEADKFLKQEVA